MAATGSLLGLAGVSAQILSAPENWNGDFIGLSPPTAQCPGGTLTQLRTRMAVSGPRPKSQLELHVPEALEANLRSEDELYSFQFSTDPNSVNYWGFSGYLIARGDCIIHVGTVGYDN